MAATCKHLSLIGIAGATLVSLSSVAVASEPTPAPEGRKFTYSFNIGATTDYVFRGYSQNKEDPTVQGGIDLTYGIIYGGLWASGVNFGNNGDTSQIANTEIDFYAGIKPVWGPATFDFGVIYYAYPGANDKFKFGQTKEQDYVEGKIGVSGAFIPQLQSLTLGGTFYYTPEYQAGQNEVYTIEGSAAYTLPAIGPITATISALIGAQYGDASDGFALGNGSDELAYWNAGITLAIEKFSLDFRYWDTDVKDTATFKCNGPVNQCDERFSFTGKFTY